MAIVASTLLNVGKGVQKWKVVVLRHKTRVLAPEHRRDFAIWGAGVLMTTVASIFYSLALKFTDKPSTVSSLNGVGLIGLVLFAWLVLKERVGSREVAGAGLVILGTAVMGMFDVTIEGHQQFSLAGFLLCAGAMTAVFVPAAVIAWRTRKLHGLTFGAIAGSMIGSSMVLGDVALVAAGEDIFGQMAGPWVYIALGVGTGALIITQVAFWRADAMVVVPTINSFVILTPSVIQYFAFGTVLAPAQYVGIAIIVAGVVPLTMGERKPAVPEVALSVEPSVPG
jgi:drug/metabolite transporter (DMT)-like permease